MDAPANGSDGPEHVPGAVNQPPHGPTPHVVGSSDDSTGSLLQAMAGDQQIATDAPRSGKALFAQLRVRHAVDRSMAGMRLDVKKLFGEDIDDDGEKLEVLERASVEALEARLKEKRCFVGPEHHYRQIWDLVQVFLLIYVAVTIPYREGYMQPVRTWSATFWFEVVVDVYFICDIAFNFRTAIFDHEGVLVLDTKEISRQYFKGKGSKMKAFKIIRLLRLTKMLRVARIKRIFQRYEEQFAAGSMHKVVDGMRMVGYLVILAYITHVVGCLWYAVGFEEEVVNGVLKPGWIEKNGLITVDRHVVGTDEDGNEILARGVWSEREEKVPISRHVLTAFYWSITTLTTVGYGDITADTTAEMLMSIVAEMLGGMIFGMLVGVVGTAITAGRLADQKYKEQMEKIGEYMRIKEVPLTLRRRIRVFYENLYKQSSVFDESEFLAKMSPQLKTETVQFLYRNIIGKVPILGGLADQTVLKICLALSPYTAVRGDVIMRDGEDGDCFFIIIKGEVKMSVLDQASKEDVTVGVFGEGSFFGEEAVITYYVKGQNPDCTIQRTETAVAVSDSQLAFMRREEAGKFMDDYEVFKLNLLHAYRKRQQRADRKIKEYSQALSNTENSSATKSGALKKGRVSQKRMRRGSVDQLVSGLIDNKRPIPANPAGNASDPLRSQSPSPTSTSMTGGGASGLGSADIEAVLDKLTMMEKRQESVHAENHHRMLGLTAQYDSLGERLAAIERMLESIVTTADS